MTENKKQTLDILGVRVDRVDRSEALAQVRDFLQKDGLSQILTVNAEMIYYAQQHAEFKNLIKQVAMVTPDGSGVVWAAKYLGMPLPERVTGIDLMDDICREAVTEGWRLYLLGGRPEVAKKAALNLEKKFPGLQIVGYNHGYFKDSTQMIAKINQEKPDIVFAALGFPKQDFWLWENREAIKAKVGIGVGGSFDVYAEIVRRAPLWMQRLHLEWLARVLQDPKRFGRVLALPKFVLKVLVSKTAKNKKN